jgi:hypothetical protein
MSGKLGPGGRLPSERQLAAQLDAGRTTARLVLMRLATEGMIRNEHGRGLLRDKNRRTGEAGRLSHAARSDHHLCTDVHRAAHRRPDRSQNVSSNHAAMPCPAHKYGSFCIAELVDYGIQARRRTGRSGRDLGVPTAHLQRNAAGEFRRIDLVDGDHTLRVL